MNRDKTPYQTDEFREKRRIGSKQLWENEDYRKKVSEGVSKGQKDSWVRQGSERIQGKKKHAYPLALEIAKEYNFSIITPIEEYIKNGKKFEIRCENGHISHLTWKQLKNGFACNDCLIENKLNQLLEVCDKKNYEIINVKYSSTKLPLNVDLICDKGHQWDNVFLGNLLKGHECRHCMRYVSNIEFEIRNFLDMYNINYIQSDRILIAPYELDFILPDYKIAIEFDGYPYHTEIIGGKGRDYHLKKTKLCEELGYQLIHIFYDEWEYPLREITNKRLLHILGKDESNKIYARKCIIKNIDTKTYKEFCISNHLQGYVQASVKLGLFYNNELVSIMSFSKPNRAKGNIKDKTGVWELTRACSSCRIIGGSSKLLEYFKSNFIWNKIITYADRRWSIGNVYEKIGFTFIRNTQPNYWYLNSKAEKFYRYQFRKSQLNGIGTEWEQMQKLGYDRIWDCGHKLYEMNN